MTPELKRVVELGLPLSKRGRLTDMTWSGVEQLVHQTGNPDAVLKLAKLVNTGRINPNDLVKQYELYHTKAQKEPDMAGIFAHTFCNVMLDGGHWEARPEKLVFAG